MHRQVIFLIIVLLSNVVQCITGFAGTVLAMPFSIMAVGYAVAKPILNVLGLAASFAIAVPNYKQVNYKELAKMLGGMLAGMVIGVLINRHFSLSDDEALICRILGVLVILFAIYNAVRHFRKTDDKKLPAVVNLFVLVSAGTVHGIFVCGGPLLVTYASSKMTDKDEFRSTVSASWILLNGLIALWDYRAGYFTPPTVRLTLISIAVLAAALLIGKIIYKKLNKEVFLILTYVLMLISGISLLAK